MKNIIKNVLSGLMYIVTFVAVQSIVLAGIVFSFIFLQIAQLISQGKTIEYSDVYRVGYKLADEIFQNTLLYTAISGVITLLILWVFFLLRKKKFLKEANVFKIETNQILPFFLIGVGFNLFITAIIEYAPFPASWRQSYEMQSSVLITDNILISVLAIGILAPIVEEIIFRGLAFSRFKRCMPPILAMIISSAIFGYIHGPIIWVLYAGAMGMLLVWITHRFENTTPAIITHMGFNMVGVAIGDFELPDIFIMMFTIIGTVILYFAIKKMMTFKVNQNIEDIKTIEDIQEF